MEVTVEDLARRRGQYGVDGGIEALGPLGALSLALMGLGLALLVVRGSW
jgi:hypothetical protein